MIIYFFTESVLSSSVREKAMLVAWSATRSSPERRSENIMPASAVHSFLVRRGSLTVEYRKKPYEAYKKALFLSILLNLLVLVCARYDIIKRKEVFLCT